MSLTPVNVSTTIAANLVATAHVGVSMPKFALGVANGLCQWALAAKVSVVGSGTTGTGLVSTPLVVPQPLLLANLQTYFPASGVVGFFSPLTALGLANGFTTALLQGILTVPFPGVGSGAGVAKLVAPPATPFMLAGFASVGNIGPGAAKLALGTGLALDSTFAVFSMPVPIVGPSGSAPGSGVALGQII